MTATSPARLVHRLAGGLLAGLLTLLPLAAAAQNRNCADHADVTLRLADVYGESRQAMALAANNSVVEIWASLETGTWTITVTTAGGPTCMVAAGEHYQVMADALPNTDPGA